MEIEGYIKSLAGNKFVKIQGEIMYIKQRIGIIGEEIAQNYLKSINYEILDRNFNCKQGETI